MHLLHNELRREISMRRKKDDKRVLRAGNGRDTRSSRKFNKRRYKSNNNRYVPPTRQKKTLDIQR